MGKDTAASTPTPAGAGCSHQRTHQLTDFRPEGEDTGGPRPPALPVIPDRVPLRGMLSSP
jgi:hypothetical protein